MLMIILNNISYNTDPKQFKILLRLLLTPHQSISFFTGFIHVFNVAIELCR